ncbi:glycosyltransferase family 4 protein [Flavitalea sp. BT771]|uniref:glycosyltransferase family 4 protein n=1 Tax=Flavitalea sp. BT771 TaxID=3063329 RepID=UPI0026E32529|nr:glycosyltransferase family 4 protein [Flavitalea sp. BT771]MDO6434159.1 glycosyltransferase family 4 protein [Flavitalea sp. BT771]MDV6223059.1 glycosyltransferase family 4 protein [Flavitalea sp. BT771]
MVFFLPDAIGGVYSVVNNLLDHVPDPGNVAVVAYSNECVRREQISTVNNNVRLIKFSYHCKDNIYHTVGGLGSLIGKNNDCIIATDMLELQMVQFLGLRQPVVLIVLGDFGHYYSIAEEHEGVIDSFVAISREIYEKLCHLLPHRRNDIRLAYFPTPAVHEKRTASAAENLRVVYVSRLEERKNPLLIPEIDAILKSRGTQVTITIVGDGPLRGQLETAIGGRSNFRLTGFLDNQRLHEIYKENDVFLMTSESEGLPVSLIEAMKTGLVPVVSDIPGGIREIVENGKNGYLVEAGNAPAFAERIGELVSNRGLYNNLSANAVEFADSTFDPIRCSRLYWDIIAETSNRDRVKTYRPAPPGALDKKWLPNSVVRFLRNTKLKSN